MKKQSKTSSKKKGEEKAKKTDKPEKEADIKKPEKKEDIKKQEKKPDKKEEKKLKADNTNSTTTTTTDLILNSKEKEKTDEEKIQALELKLSRLGEASQDDPLYIQKLRQTIQKALRHEKALQHQSNPESEQQRYQTLQHQKQQLLKG